MTDVIARGPRAPCAGDWSAMARTYVPIHHPLGQPMVWTPGQTKARPPERAWTGAPRRRTLTRGRPKVTFPPRMTWRPAGATPFPTDGAAPREVLPYRGRIRTVASCSMTSGFRSDASSILGGASTGRVPGPPRRFSAILAPFEPRPSPPAGTCERSSRRLRCSPGQRPRRHRRRHLFVDEAKLPLNLPSNRVQLLLPTYTG